MDQNRSRRAGYAPLSQAGGMFPRFAPGAGRLAVVSNEQGHGLGPGSGRRGTCGPFSSRGHEGHHQACASHGPRESDLGLRPHPGCAEEPGSRRLPEHAIGPRHRRPTKRNAERATSRGGRSPSLRGPVCSTNACCARSRFPCRLLFLWRDRPCYPRRTHRRPSRHRCLYRRHRTRHRSCRLCPFACLRCIRPSVGVDDPAALIRGSDLKASACRAP